jgi:hypothetical protein
MKSKTFVYKSDLQVVDYQDVKDSKTRMLEITPRESIANYLANCPSNFVDSFIAYIADSVKFSNESGEDHEAMQQRIYHDIMKLTTEYKNA